MERSEVKQDALTPQQPEYHRVIVLKQRGSELLVVPNDTQFLLPCQEIQRGQRVPEAICSAMNYEWNCSATYLFEPEPDYSPNGHTRTRYVVMEYCDLGRSSPRNRWIPMSSLSQNSFADSRDHTAVEQSLAMFRECERGVAPGPFAKPGWFDELCRWVDAAIEPLGLELNGGFRQLNASPSFSLIRFETNGPALWFKAVGEPNLREYPITLTLAQLFPKFVPPILAHRSDRNGWLALEAEGLKLGETSGGGNWKTAMERLAQLQIESVEKHDQLLISGARDLRASSLSTLVDPFLNAMSELMEQQTKIPPPALSREVILLLGEEIQDALIRFEQLNIPDALGHLDLNPGNIIISRNACVFLDWAEGYVGPPFFSFRYLLEHWRRAVGPDSVVEVHLTASYAERWQTLVSPCRIKEALTLTPLLAAFAYAVGNDSWVDPERLRDPSTAGYLRSLTRIMAREAGRLMNREAACLS